ncbi:PPE family protein [Mycobacterium lepraemurium]|nr:PPE family protein [Mycobacterium lepraemurium]ATA27214.1 PPE family protein [Mycobacterium lepraemurium]
MADPGWAARTPEDNDMLLKAGVGVGTHVANQTAWTTLAATHHASGVASAINTAATSASWLGAGSAASAANVTMLNASLHGLAGWVDVKPAVVATAISAYQMAYGSMRPAPECIANRTETATGYGINPLVLGALTPRIASLELEYYGSMWPNNSAVGASYGAVLTALAESLAIASMGASPAASAEAVSAIGESAANVAAGDGMRAAYQGVQTGTQGAGQAASSGQDLGGQMSSLMQPVQELTGAVPQAMQAPMQMMQPLQSMMGMFANPGAMGTGGAAPGVSAVSAATGLSAAEAGAGGAGSLGGAGVPATSFTRPVSAFEPATSGRPVGLRPAGALGAEALRPQTTTMSGAPMGGMPVGHGAGGQRGSRDKAEEPATVRVVDDRV